MTYKTNPPAFPVMGVKDGYGVVSGGQKGMSLRDYFAGQALAAMGSMISDEGSPDVLLERPGILAKWAYKYADAMLKAREVSNA